MLAQGTPLSPLLFSTMVLAFIAASFDFSSANVFLSQPMSFSPSPMPGALSLKMEF